MTTKTSNKKLLIGILGVTSVVGGVLAFTSLPLATENRCPTPETFVEDFNNWSIEFLDGHPEYAEKEQREGWQKHLEEMGCIEARDIIDDAICADCEAG